MSKFGVLLMLVWSSFSQVTSSAIPIHDHHSHEQFLNVDEEITDIPDLITAGTPTACKGEFRRVGEHCYHFSHTAATWLEASKACQRLDAALAHPENSVENSLLASCAREDRTIHYWWIGATDRDKEGQWLWSHDNTPVGYSDWQSGEPNNEYDNEHCALYSRRGYYWSDVMDWNDSPCENKHHYICQYEDVNGDSQSFTSGDGKLKEMTVGTTITTVASIHASKSDFVQLVNHSYYISQTKAAWYDAYKTCQSLDSQLAHPWSEEENSQLTQYLRENRGTAVDWWIGGTDRYKEGQWVWAHDNTSISFTDWESGEPDDRFENEDCALIRRYRDYRWSDAPCNNKYNFICQSEDSNEDSSDESSDVSSSEEELEDTNPCKRTISAVATDSAQKSLFTKVGDNCYHFSLTKATFDDVSKACQNLDAEFDHPMNEEENSQLTNYIRNKYKDDPRGWWIGAKLGDNEGEWVWAHDNSPVGYADWSIHESHESHENEDCAFYGRKSDYKWNDVPCGNKYYYICQYPKLNASQELPSGEVETSEEDTSEEEDTAHQVVTSGEVEAEIEENTEPMIANAATWKLNGWCYAVMIACVLITQRHIAI